MLVLDVSRSIKPEANRTITDVLQQLIRSQSRLGLVAFSDIAYQLLPPGTPSRELRSLLRFFARAFRVAATDRRCRRMRRARAGFAT